jgi:hypothetical protein
VCRQEWQQVFVRVFNKPELPPNLTEPVPPIVASEPAFEFVWRFAEDSVRDLLLRLASRSLYKRILDFPLGELGESAEYARMQREFVGSMRITHADEISKNLINAIDKTIRLGGNRRITTSESAARTRVQSLGSLTFPLVVIDFPTRGLPEETNFPTLISDPNRKYFSIPPQTRDQDFRIFHDIRRLQARNASVRVFAAPELHELVLRYLEPKDVRECVGESIPMLRLPK